MWIKFVGMRLVNVFLCRHPIKSVFSFGLFGTAPIGGEVWLLALAGAVLMGVLEETRKATTRQATEK